MGTPDTRELRRFGLSTGFIVALLFGVVLPWLFDHSFRLWPWMVGGVLSGWALVWPQSLLPVYRAWMAVGQVLGRVNSRIILGLMYYVMIVPLGCLMRLFGRDPMRRGFDMKAVSYRVQSKNQSKDHLEKPF